MATGTNVAGATADAGATRPVDLAHLDRATFGSRALRDEVLRLFDQQAVRLEAEIANATDVRARSEAAHGLRGAALGIGANAVAKAAGEIEAGPADMTAAVARLSARVAEVRLAIGDLLTKN
jgi:hypothetical protein